MNVGHYVSGVKWENLTKEYQDYCDKEDYLEEPYSVPYEAVDYFTNENDFYFYEDEFEDYVNGLLKEYPRYIVCAFNHTWDKRTGYKVVKELKEAFMFDYEVSIYLEETSKHNKSALFKIHSHDNPMGSNFIILGLTYNEFEKVENMGFDSAIDFIKSKTKIKGV
jgi:hypothetical protein